MEQRDRAQKWEKFLQADKHKICITEVGIELGESGDAIIAGKAVVSRRAEQYVCVDGVERLFKVDALEADTFGWAACWLDAR